MKTQSKYHVGWIGFRVSKRGKATRELKRLGAIELDHAQLNNRNGFDFVLPCVDRQKWNAADFSPLAAKGLEAIAIWFTDAQWGLNAGITSYQWQQRKMIDPA